MRNKILISGFFRSLFIAAALSFLLMNQAQTQGSLKEEIVKGSGIVSFSKAPDNKTFASAMEDNTVRIWHSDNQKYLTLSEFGSKISRIEFSPDGKTIAVAYGNEISLWTKEGKKIRTLERHTEWVRSIAFSPDGKYLFSGSEDNTIIQWKTDGKFMNTIKTHEDNVNALSVSFDSKTLISGDDDGIIILRDISQAGKELLKFKAHDSGITYVSFSPDGKKVYTASHDDTVIIWSLTGEKQRSLEGHSSSVRDIAFSYDGKFIITAADDDSVKIWGDEKDALVTSEEHEEPVTGVKFISKNKILTSSMDGTHIILDLKGKVLGKIILTETGKLIYLKDGRFEYDEFHSLNALSYKDSETNEVVTLEKIHDTFYSPGIFQALISGNISAIKTNMGDLIQKSPPPEVSIIKSEITDPDSGTVAIEVQACDKGGGIGEIFLYQNETLVTLENTKGLRLVADKKCQIRKAVLLLAEGNNSFRASAKSEMGLESFSGTIVLSSSTLTRTKPNLHILLVAVDIYKNKALTLKYAVKDAQAIKAKFTEKEGKLYSNVYTYEAYNEKANKEGIAKLFSSASSKIKINDTVFIFFSGHGFSENKTYYFIQQDNPANNENEIKSGISQSDLIKYISSLNANKKLIVLDTCQSGGDWLVALRGLDELAAVNILARTAGIWVIAASQENEYAMESTKTGHGLLTSALLEGLEGKARLDGKLSAGALVPWVNKRVPELAKTFFNREQYPYTAQRGQDFQIVE